MGGKGYLVIQSIRFLVFHKRKDSYSYSVLIIPREGELFTAALFRFLFELRYTESSTH